jgi:hypothetical protein
VGGEQRVLEGEELLLASDERGAERVFQHPSIVPSAEARAMIRTWRERQCWWRRPCSSGSPHAAAEAEPR